VEVPPQVRNLSKPQSEQVSRLSFVGREPVQLDLAAAAQQSHAILAGVEPLSGT
jgi:hypothetical protein